jgi:hypothetical protein
MEAPPMDDPASQPFFDRLFAAPLSEFIAVRKTLARELRDRGLPDASATLAACSKPTASAWALNQVAREHAAVMGRFLAAAEQARRVIHDAKRSREVQGALAAAATEVVRLAKEALVAGGIGATATHVGRIERGLRAAPLVSEADRQRLARGRLSNDIDLSGELGVFGESGDAPRPDPDPALATSVPASAKDRKEEAARAAKAKADREEALRLERERRELVRAAQTAEAHADRLEAIAARAHADLADARARAETASQQAADARAQAKAARDRAPR